jgi:hypothetical protein
MGGTLKYWRRGFFGIAADDYHEPPGTVESSGRLPDLFLILISESLQGPEADWRQGLSEVLAVGP